VQRDIQAYCIPRPRRGEGRPTLSGASEEHVEPTEPTEVSGTPTQERPPATTSEQEKPGGWRRWVPWVLVVVAAVVTLLAGLNVWVKRQALDTNNFTKASAQLLENDDIRNAISVYMVDQLFQQVDVAKTLEQRLPPRAKPLAAPLAASLQPAAIRIADDILGRPRVQQLWKNAVRRAHELFIAVLNGKHGVLTNTNGNVVLNLRPLMEQLTQRLGFGQRIVAQLPPNAGQITIMKGNQLHTARRAVKVVRVTSYFLAFLVLALFALAVYIARMRRRAVLLGAGISVLLVGLLLLVVRRFAGTYLVDALTNNADEKKPISAAWAIGTQLLRNVGVNLVIYGTVVVIAAWIAGPSRPAVAFRRFAAPTMRDRPYIAYGLLTVVLLIILLTGPTDSQRIYPLLVLFALAYIGLEVLRRQTAREFPTGQHVLTS
jgi:hypothetical protein